MCADNVFSMCTENVFSMCEKVHDLLHYRVHACIVFIFISIFTIYFCIIYCDSKKNTYFADNNFLDPPLKSYIHITVL